MIDRKMKNIQNGRSTSTPLQVSSSLLLPGLLLALCLVVYLAIVVPGLRLPVTGYLHSWNQITTLVSIKQISKDPQQLLTPRDVVTRVTREPPGETVDSTDRSDRFVIYEEFPLYHILSAALNWGLNTLEGGARVLSLIFFLFGAIGLYSLTKHTADRQAALYTLSLYATSFPFLYYGQAAMSDMAMTAFAIWGVALLQRYVTLQSSVYLYAAVISIALAGLMKSYGIVLALCFFYLYWYRNQLQLKNYPGFAKVIVLMFLSAAPTLGWHLFASFQAGLQEYESHSLSSKMLYLAMPELYRSLLKIWFRYLGYLPGVILVLAVLLKFIKQNGKSIHQGLPWWFKAWGLSSLVYLVATADKLLHHDYYFLLVFPPFFFLGGVLLANIFNRTRLSSNRLAVTAVCFVIVSNAIIGNRSLLKATSPNPDVMGCAKLIREHTSPGEMIATLSDLSRYNSLAFYSNRLAVNVEQDAFPLSRYIHAGATLLALNLPPEDHEQFRNTLLNPEIPAVARAELFDFKKRLRVCALYRL